MINVTIPRAACKKKSIDPKTESAIASSELANWPQNPTRFTTIVGLMRAQKISRRFPGLLQKKTCLGSFTCSTAERQGNDQA
jgi:hypothetical protein